MYMEEHSGMFEHSGTTAAFEQEYSAAATSAALEVQQQQQGLVVGYENNNMNLINGWQYHQEHHQQQDQLLNLFHFSPSSSSAVYVDPLLHLNPPSLFGHYPPARLDGLYLDSVADGAGAVLEFGGARERSAGRDRGGAATATKHFASERHRRDQMRDTYSMLRSLVPNPTKNDRASVVGDAIEYIKELRRSVNELTMLVERKRQGGQGAISKRHKPQQQLQEEEEEEEEKGVKAEEQHYNNSGHIRTSWLQRKSKDTEVDVRIVDDEVTVKLVQRKKINLLLLTSRVLDDLRLDLRHVAGGHVGDTYSYLFNTKICQGSSLYASAIANKLIDVLDRQYASVTF